MSDMKTLRYVRVSSQQQNTSRQIEEGDKTKYDFFLEEKVSGKTELFSREKGSIIKELVLEGKVDVVLQCSNKIWDIQPLIPIIKAAGGIVSTWNNQNAIKAGNIICSSNKRIHKRVLKILRPVVK